MVLTIRKSLGANAFVRVPIEDDSHVLEQNDFVRVVSD
jgi:hypothetical protein